MIKTIVLECNNFDDLMYRLSNLEVSIGNKQVACMLAIVEGNNDDSGYERFELKNEAIRKWNKLVNNVNTS